MKIEMKEVITLTLEEKEAVNATFVLMGDILEQVNDPDIYNAVKQINDGLDEFIRLVETD